MVRRIATGITIALLGVMFFGMALLIHPFGEPPAAMDDYIIENSQKQAGANNAVAAVVFDYRGYDTLGEATILFTAATAVVMLLVKRHGEDAD